MTFKTLYHRAKTGKLYQWTIRTEGSTIITDYGAVDGEKLTAYKEAKPKNVGKANETSGAAQAILEATAEYKKKLKLKYFENVKDVDTFQIACMKAPIEKWENTKHRVIYPAHVQPKLDGARCLAYWQDNRVVLLSRGKEEWDLPHISEQIAAFLPKDVMLDGELYIHGLKRQEIQHLIASKSKMVEYHVYDLPLWNGESLLWDSRRNYLAQLFNDYFATIGSSIVWVTTHVVLNEEEVDDLCKSYVSLGYEGVMVRNRGGKYEWGHRSYNLLKNKPFDDAEFKIVGFKDGDGKNVGAVTWVCTTAEGKVFDVDPIGSYTQRRKLFKAGEEYIGQLLTVQYKGLSNDGIPQIPKGIAIRLPKDMDHA